MSAPRLHGIGDASALVPYSGPVHHYTSSEGLLQIVSSGKLRVSEATSLNDLAEVKLGWETIDNWLSEKNRGKGGKFIRATLKRARRDPRHQVFILSGTTASDDANQWRLYADNGRGYAIQLDGSMPLGVVSLDPIEDQQGTKAWGRVTEFANVVPWFHVLYDEAALTAAVRSVAKHVEQEMSVLDSLVDPEAKELGYYRLSESVMDELAMIAHLYKSSGFSGEREVRVVARFLWFGKHVGYHSSRYGIAGHVHLTGAEGRTGPTTRVIPEPSMKDAGRPGWSHPLAISGVRLGPLVHKSNEETVKALLDAYGLGAAAVSRSKVPLR